MAVYERTFRRYDGPLTDLRWRCVVITRYALEGVFASRLFTAFYAGCALPTLVGAVPRLPGPQHRPARAARRLPRVPARADRASFFQKLFIWQAVPAFFISVMVGPGLVAPDLSNSALPLYLSRPITRRDYVLGKLAVLLGLLSPVTWVRRPRWCGCSRPPSRGAPGGATNFRIALAYLVGHGVWILVVSLLTLAVSAWVRLKPAGGGGPWSGCYLFLGAIAQSVNGMTGTKIGSVFNLVESVYVVVATIFKPDAPTELPPLARMPVPDHRRRPVAPRPALQAQGARGGAMSRDAHRPARRVKFYGEVLGVNRVNLDIPPGLTGLVGPNGSGKSTLMHLSTGLLRPTRGEIAVLGVPPHGPRAADAAGRLLHPVRLLPARCDRALASSPRPAPPRAAPPRPSAPAWECSSRSGSPTPAAGGSPATPRACASGSSSPTRSATRPACRDPRRAAQRARPDGPGRDDRAVPRSWRPRAATSSCRATSCTRWTRSRDAVVMIHGGSVVAEGRSARCAARSRPPDPGPDALRPAAGGRGTRLRARPRGRGEAARRRGERARPHPGRGRLLRQPDRDCPRLRGRRGDGAPGGRERARRLRLSDRRGGRSRHERPTWASGAGRRGPSPGR